METWRRIAEIRFRTPRRTLVDVPEDNASGWLVAVGDRGSSSWGIDRVKKARNIGEICDQCAGGTVFDDGERLFRASDSQFALRVPGPTLGTGPDGQPTQQIVETRRTAEFITPIPKPRKRKKSATQEDFVFDEGTGLSTAKQRYEAIPIINELRRQVDQWRQLPSPNDWLVTPETARLLQHWRHHQFQGIRPFFCQVEAVETAIWLTEVAPKLGKTGKRFLEHLANANAEANPELTRLALKLATGAGKTTVMAMLIAWQTINAVRRPGSTHFTRGFLVVTPGLTIKDRLRVLQPNDPDSYYASRELVPPDMLDDVKRAKIVITNYHAFKLRERMEISKGGRALLEGRHGAPVNTLETEGQMIQRVMPDLMGLKNILVLNDEAHHCYKEKPGEPDEDRTTRRRQGRRPRRTTKPLGSGSTVLKPSSARSASRASWIFPRRPSFCAAPAMPRARFSRGRCPTSR